MRLAVLMDLRSPWSRHMVVRIGELGHSIHVVDFKYLTETNGSKSSHESFQSEDIAAFCNSVADVHLIEPRFTSDLRHILSAPQIAKICRDSGAEGLLTLYAGGFAFAAWLSRVRPFFVCVAGSDVLLVKGIKRRLTRIALQSADHVFVNGGYLAKKTRELAPDAKVDRLLHGVDTVRFSPSSIISDPVKILCARGFKQVYNNQYIIEALSIMPNLSSDFQVTFTSYGSLLDSVRSLANRLLKPEIYQEIKFLGGVSEQTYFENMRNSHIYISMSRSDGTSNALLEAMACGLFPVLSDIPQNREWIDPSANNGILVPLDQPEVLAAALSRIIPDKSWRARVIEYNRNLVLERGCEHRNTKFLASEIESVIRSYGEKDKLVS